jgi:hypothetical protein
VINHFYDINFSFSRKNVWFLQSGRPGFVKKKKP